MTSFALAALLTLDAGAYLAEGAHLRSTAVFTAEAGAHLDLHRHLRLGLGYGIAARSGDGELSVRTTLHRVPLTVAGVLGAGPFELSFALGPALVVTTSALDDGARVDRSATARMGVTWSLRARYPFTVSQAQLGFQVGLTAVHHGARDDAAVLAGFSWAL